MTLIRVLCFKVNVIVRCTAQAHSSRGILGPETEVQLGTALIVLYKLLTVLLNITAHRYTILYIISHCGCSLGPSVLDTRLHHTHHVIWFIPYASLLSVISPAYCRIVNESRAVAAAVVSKIFFQLLLTQSLVGTYTSYCLPLPRSSSNILWSRLSNVAVVFSVGLLFDCL